MAKYLRIFLEWLPKQTFFENLEVVLDHNEPEPKELEWIHDFQQRYPGRLKHLVVESVDPIGVSMNRCIRAASGDLLAIWNVDDLRTPQSIEMQARALVETPGIDIVYGDYLVVGNFNTTTGIKVTHQEVPESEFTRSMIFGPFFMFRKSLCANAGYFDEQLKSGADFDFAVRLAMHGKATMVRNPLGYYLNEGLGASTRPNSLQPVERTVVELRYGIYDKIDYSLLPRALEYDISHLHYGNSSIRLTEIVPEYEKWIEFRARTWLTLGIEKFCAQRKHQRSFMRKSRSVVHRFAQRIKRVILRNKNENYRPDAGKE